MKAIIDKFTIYLLLLMFSINASAQVRLGGNPEALNLFALSPDGETLAGSNFPGTIHLWDTATGAEKDVFISEFTIGAGAVLTFSPDGTLLASGSEKNRVTLWDVNTGEAKFVLEHFGANELVRANSISSITFSPDGTTLASCAAGRWGTSSRYIYLWDVETGEKKSEISRTQDDPFCSTFSPDGNTLAIGTRGKDIVYLWDIHKNIEIARLSIPNVDFSVGYVKFSPDGTTLAAGIKYSSLITLWNVVTRKEINRLPGYSDFWLNSSFAFNPDGTLLAGHGIDGLYLWNVSNEERKRICEPPMFAFAGVSPDGTIYAIENQYELVDGDWVRNTYSLWSISPEEVFMDVAAHGKLTTRWVDLKMSE